jgi:DNA-binding XRE family transcriptional regulator
MSRRLKALEAKLDARKQKAAYLLVENELRETGEKRSQEDIAEEVGVTSKTIWSWKTTDPVFIEYKNAIADDFLSEKRAFVYAQLMKTISGPQPSIKGIDVFMRRFGLLTEKQVVVNEDLGGSRSNEDLARELADLDDLLNEE